MTSAKGLSYLLADVHLHTESSHPINQAFLQFIHQQACFADEVYILGDLFEAWAGDDLHMTDYQVEIEALKNLSRRGVKLYIAYGNRDFLMRHVFWQASGAQWINEGYIAHIQGQNYILMHGDSLCTQDKAYQRMRRLFRAKWFQWLFLHLPQKTRLKIAQGLRQQSQQAGSQKSYQIMDVADDAVIKVFNQHPQIKHLVHGHTHRPAHHQLNINGLTKHRWVLGDWRPDTHILKIEHGQPQLIEFKALGLVF